MAANDCNTSIRHPKPSGQSSAGARGSPYELFADETIHPRTAHCIANSIKMRSMEAQVIRISMDDSSGGYRISPNRVPLSTLRSFAKDVDDFLRGDSGEISLKEIEVAVSEGSLAVVTRPLAAPGLLHDLLALSSSYVLDSVNSRRRAIVEKWQRLAKSPRDIAVTIAAPFLGESTIVIDRDADFHPEDADRWVRVERYVLGEILELGGTHNVNAHLRLRDGRTLLIKADRDTLRSDDQNRLFKPTMVRIVAEYNIVTREYREAELIQFSDYQGTRVDEKALEKLRANGEKAWADVENAGEWVELERGGRR